jgi:hypothetical protein
MFILTCAVPLELADPIMWSLVVLPEPELLSNLSVAFGAGGPPSGFVPLDVSQSELLSIVRFVLRTGGPPTWLGAPGRLSLFLT